MEENVILECGCERGDINGKIIWVLCDEHDEEGHPIPDRTPLKKFRKTHDND